MGNVSRRKFCCQLTTSFGTTLPAVQCAFWLPQWRVGRGHKHACWSLICPYWYTKRQYTKRQANVRGCSRYMRALSVGQWAVCAVTLCMQGMHVLEQALGCGAGWPESVQGVGAFRITGVLP